MVVSMVASSTIHIWIWENPWGGGNLVSSSRDGTSSIMIFDGAQLSWVSQWDKPRDAFHMVVNLC